MVGIFFYLGGQLGNAHPQSYVLVHVCESGSSPVARADLSSYFSAESPSCWRIVFDQGFNLFRAPGGDIYTSVSCHPNDHASMSFRMQLPCVLVCLVESGYEQ